MPDVDLTEFELLAGVGAVCCDEMPEVPDAVTAAARAVYTQHRLEVLFAAACPIADVADDGLLLSWPPFPVPEQVAR